MGCCCCYRAGGAGTAGGRFGEVGACSWRVGLCFIGCVSELWLDGIEGCAASWLPRRHGPCLYGGWRGSSSGPAWGICK